MGKESSATVRACVTGRGKLAALYLHHTRCEGASFKDIYMLLISLNVEVTALSDSLCHLQNETMRNQSMVTHVYINISFC